MSASAKFYLIAATAILIAVRFLAPFPPHPLSFSASYQAVAHLFVGGLFGYGLATRNRLALALTFVLCMAEIGAAVVARLP